MQGRALNLESLQDGEYTMEIDTAELTMTQRTNETIIRWVYRVVSGPGHIGQKIENASFIRNQEQANMIGADLLVLGIPTNEWLPGHKSGKKFSKELPLALKQIVGYTMTAAKTSKVSGSRTYHNLRIKGKTVVSDMPAEPLPF
jgi:hypothetical protein